MELRHGRILGGLVVAGLLAVACSEDADSSSAQPAPTTAPASSTSSTSSTSTTAAPNTTTSGLPAAQVAVDARVERVGDHALLAEVIVDAAEPVSVTIDVEGDGVGFATPPTEPGTSHRVPILGMRADADHTLTVRAELADGRPVATSVDLAHRTGALPPEIPEINLFESVPDRMEPGLTLFDFGRFLVDRSPDLPPERQPILGLIVAVDQDGEVVWYHQATHPIGEARQLPGGDILYNIDNTVARRITPLGETVTEWATRFAVDRFRADQWDRPVLVGDEPPVVIDTDAMHHEVTLSDDGTELLFLSTELRRVEGYPAPRCGEASAGFTGGYDLITDTVVRADAVTGEIISEWSLFDHVDPYEDRDLWDLCPGPTFVFPNYAYLEESALPVDWTHANAVVHDEARNAAVVSLRHQDALVAFRYEDDGDGPAGELLWWFGPDGGLDLVDGDWTYHQHAPEIDDDGHYLIYDNGNSRPGTGGDGEPPLFSRVVEYEIGDDGTVRQLWERPSVDVDGEPLYASFVGDADRLANGNILINNGGLASPFGSSDLAAQIVEVAPGPGDGGEVLWRIQIDTGTGTGVYRAQRIASLYG